MYQIGQILFVVLNSKQQIFPMQVVEMVTKKTLQGEEVKYCLQAGSDKTTKIMLDQLDGEVFTSAEEAKSTLVERATLQIYALIDAAQKKAKTWYDNSHTIQESKIPEPKIAFIDEQKVEKEDSDHTVMLPDGQIARVRFTPNNEA